MNIKELKRVKSDILNEEEMLLVLGGELEVNEEEPDLQGTHTSKCNKCSKCDKCIICF